MDAFPRLPDRVLKTFPKELLELEALGQRPSEWSELAPGKLSDLLFHSCYIYGLLPENDRVAALQGLFSVVVTRLDTGQRLEVLQRLSDYYEDARLKKRQPLGGNAFFVFMYDPDDQIASTGALSAAAWLGENSDQAEYGRKTVLDFAMVTKDINERARILAGLTALGDRLSNSWVRPLWMELKPEGRKLVCDAATAVPATASIDLLLNLVDDALDLGREQQIAIPLGALGKIALRSSGKMPGSYSGRGIVDIDRKFPAWVAGDQAVVGIVQTWTTQEYAPLVIPRLESIAAREVTLPKAAPTIIGYWRDR